MIVTQNESGVKPAWKKTCRACVPVAACRAKNVRRVGAGEQWWSDFFTVFNITAEGRQALAETKQELGPMETALARIEAHYPIVSLVSEDDSPFGPYIRFRGPGQESVTVELTDNGDVDAYGSPSLNGRRTFFCDLTEAIGEPAFARSAFMEAARRFLAAQAEGEQVAA